MRKANFYIVILSCVIPLSSIAQDKFDEFKKNADLSFENFMESTDNEYEAFRKRINDEYAALLEKTWKEFNAVAGIEVPENKIRPVSPVICPEDDDNKPLPSPNPLPYDDVVTVPQQDPQPQPVVPIKDIPSPVSPTVSKISFTFFGTQANVRFDMARKIILNRNDEQGIAQAWSDMSNAVYTNLVYDCLQIRKEKHLCDWAYLEMIRCLSETLLGKSTNSATMLMAYIYCQSGYKMRFAFDDNNKLYMMYASSHIVYDKSYFIIDNTMYYTYGGSPQHVYICDVSFPNERAMSLYISEEPQFATVMSLARKRQSRRYPELCTTMTSNMNLIEFYNTYPTSMVGDNLVSRWAIYANTPMSGSVKKQIYPSLMSAIRMCDQLTAVNKLLNYVQTGFEYEYDDKVWGQDRAFFAEESLYYPFCDCEDRSILFTRLVRDLVGLDCILVYYPGHLAAAVAFTDNVEGDYIQLDNRKYIICDPTYIGANAGITMPGMNNQTAKVILLKK